MLGWIIRAYLTVNVTGQKNLNTGNYVGACTLVFVFSMAYDGIGKIDNVRLVYIGS